MNKLYKIAKLIFPHRDDYRRFRPTPATTLQIFKETREDLIAGRIERPFVGYRRLATIQKHRKDLWRRCKNIQRLMADLTPLLHKPRSDPLDERHSHSFRPNVSFFPFTTQKFKLTVQNIQSFIDIFAESRWNTRSLLVGQATGYLKKFSRPATFKREAGWTVATIEEGRDEAELLETVTAQICGSELIKDEGVRRLVAAAHIAGQLSLSLANKRVVAKARRAAEKVRRDRNRGQTLTATRMPSARSQLVASVVAQAMHRIDTYGMRKTTAAYQAADKHNNEHPESMIDRDVIKNAVYREIKRRQSESESIGR